MKKNLTIRQVKCDKFVKKMKDLVDQGLPKNAMLCLADVKIAHGDFRSLEKTYILDQLKEVQD